MKDWLAAVVMALNQLGNALIGGDPDMTVSARAGYAREHGSKLAAGVCHVLDWMDTRDGDSDQGDHCNLAVESHDKTKHDSALAPSTQETTP